MRFARRLDAVPPYLFAELERKIEEKRRAGVEVISLGIGDPDLPTPQPVIDALAAGARDPETLGDALMLLMEGGYYTRLTFPQNSGPVAAIVKAARALVDAHAA